MKIRDALNKKLLSARDPITAARLGYLTRRLFGTCAGLLPGAKFRMRLRVGRLLGQHGPLGPYRRRLAKLLANASLWLAPGPDSPGSITLLPGEVLKIPALRCLDSAALQEGRAEVRSRALNSVWRGEPKQEGGMIPLREHVTRLCLAANELSGGSSSDKWRGVSENLHLAASLEALSADTDISGNSGWCRPAAEFEDADSDVAARHLAGVCVFGLVWAAYECAVEIASESFSMKQPKGKGARGRDLLVQLLDDKRFPHLRSAVLETFELHEGQAANFSTPEMRRMIARCSFAGIAAEYLREFRNAVAHGDVTKPIPGDWGDKSKYCADDDPAIRQFHSNTRITLLLIQILMRSTLGKDDELVAWLSHPQPAVLLLTQMHCVLPERSESEFELPLENVPLLYENWE